MKTDTLHRATISSLSHEGRGIAHIDGKAIFIDGALMGEEIEFRLTKRHRQYDEAEVVQVLKSSPYRITPLCEHYGVCGGCSLQHMAPEAQIQHKQQALLDLLSRIGKVNPTNILPPLVGPVWSYRSKARLGVKYVIKKEKLLVGFREKDPRYLAEISQCEVLHPAVGHQLEKLKNLINSLEAYSDIPQVEVAVSEETVALIFRHMIPLSVDDKDKLIEFGRSMKWHIYLQSQGISTIRRLWPFDGIERLSYYLSDYHLEMQYHPIDFTQINTAMNQQIVKQALQLLDCQSSETALDLFCGIGNFTLPMAQYSKKVFGIEGSETSVSRARENALHNKIHNAEFYVADLTRNSSHLSWYYQRYDKLLLDPPRTGAIDIIPGVIQWQPARIVYVSCNPATLARDAAKLHELGYNCHSAGVMDMFPHTSHVEAMALFTRTV